METDARKISNSSPVEEKYPIYSKPPDLYDEDEIHIPPSTELIPDEYEHTDNKKGLVLIFYSTSDVGNKNVLVEEFTDQKYESPKVFELTNKDDVLEKLQTVAQEETNKDKTCLIIFFLGNAEKEDKFFLDNDVKEHILLKDVWLKFTADNCPSFRNKPKIFVFQATKKPSHVRFDTRDFVVPPKGAYDVPSEADMLLVYKRVEDVANRNVFIRQLCNKIDKFGKKDDIISLVTRTTINEKRPIVISTLTRKFYVTSSKHRGHYYDIHLNHKNTMEALEDLRKNVPRPSLKKNQPMQVDNATTVKNKLKPDAKPGPKSKSQKIESRPVWK